MVKRLEDMNDEELGEWIVSTCLVWGAEAATAHQVAAIFLRGLGQSGDRSCPSPGPESPDVS